MGVIYGVAGIVITARLGGSTATLRKPARAGRRCGGMYRRDEHVRRRRPGITGVALGVLVLSAVDNVMSLMNVSSYLQMVVKGLILLLAVCMDVCIEPNQIPPEEGQINNKQRERYENCCRLILSGMQHL